jgi:hypothetical protein
MIIATVAYTKISNNVLARHALQESINLVLVPTTCRIVQIVLPENTVFMNGEAQKFRVQHALEGGIRMLDRGKQARPCARPAVRESIQIPVWPKQILAFARLVLWDVTRPTAYGSPPGTFTKDIHRIAVAKRAPLAITQTREKGGMIVEIGL